MGISWYSVIVAFYQEIATPYGLAMTYSEVCCVKPISINLNIPEKDWHDMGIVIYAPYRGRGYAVPALKLLLDYAYRELGVEDGFLLMIPLICTRSSAMMKPWNTGLLEED